MAYEPALGANSFSVSFCVRNACLSRLWHGLEQTAYILKARHVGLTLCVNTA
jgi:hypothetical protein